MTQKGYNSIIDFFGDEETSFCCLKKIEEAKGVCGDICGNSLRRA